jgi:N-methylhydantoinase A/oxoprolinase/acetone carboxylase beta subunit
MSTGESPEIHLGLDTGGTYTDAVALTRDRRVIATAKALTTPWDLSIGLGAALRAVLAGLPAGTSREHVTLVSVSTTLATNAVVENRVSPVCIVLVGFDERMVERSGLGRAAGGVVVRVRGGHDATGEEAEPLDEPAVGAAVREHGAQVEAFAVAAMFSVRNTAHEERVRDLIRAACAKPVTCSHELSSHLDAPRRALTAALNARLTPQIARLLAALRGVLGREGIAAPLMIAKGDGTLMRAEVALEYPVETVLSGPAASVVGAGFLTGLADFAVTDMGGTTTDVAIVAGGRPVVCADGAVIGGWRTMVEAIEVHTCGLGGDSEVQFDRDLRLTVGPRKAMPLSLLAERIPGVLAELRQLAACDRLPPHAGRFAFRNPGREAPADLDRLERRVWEGLAAAPCRLGDVARTASGVDAVRRLVDRGLATLAAFTPSDAMHVLGRQQGWNVEAAQLGAAILATEERNARARREADSATGICERTYQHVVREAARVLLASALAHDPGVEAKHGHWGPLGVLIEQVVAGRPFSQLIDARLRLATPLIAVGAPVGTYYPEVARRLDARLLVPERAEVCNAIGAVVAEVSESCDVLVNQPAFKVFRVHDPKGSRDYEQAEAAIEDARRVSRELALAAAQRAGACEPQVETSVMERRARGGADGDYLAEATVRSRATGRPTTARAPPQRLHP